MIDSGHGDKTAGRGGGLLKIRYANRNKNHTFSIYFQTMPRSPLRNRRTFQLWNAAASQLAPKVFPEAAAIFQLAAAQCLCAEDAPSSCGTPQP
jgi:hypothetical protein